MRGTSAQLLLVIGAVTAAMGFPRMVGKAFGADWPRPANTTKRSRWRIMLRRCAAPMGAGLILLLLSIGIIHGDTHDFGRKYESATPWMNTLTADVFWTASYKSVQQ